MYSTHYEKSHALVVGINAYESAPPLGYARQDAEAFARVLQGVLGFKQDDVQLLVDSEATRDEIMAKFLAFSAQDVGENDRLIVFFAGHGDTRTGHRGEIGYLVPVDGDPANLSSLVRWDDLTRNAELIPAKHILFIMDACYGGLALTRSLPPGSMRFVKNMLQRFSRQVLTAGKADETVADSGGPRPGHSIFTGHLLDALEGATSSPDGILTANSVMAYVYDRVARDANSNQTPDYGFIDGDGDMIFLAPGLLEESEGSEAESDTLVQVPPGLVAPVQEEPEADLAAAVKDYLSEGRFRIRLSDLADKELRSVLQETHEDVLPMRPERSDQDEFAGRLETYDKAMTSVVSIVVLTAYWGDHQHRKILERTIARLADNIESKGGMTVWLGFRWYPLQMAMYLGGIAALAAKNYENLYSLLMTNVGNSHTGSGSSPAIVPTIDGMLDVDRAEAFKKLPGHERNYAPRSEYMFKVAQPHLENLLFLGSAYEDLFDRFEILFALACADVTEKPNRRIWGPPGRFAWKHKSGHGRSPFEEIVSEQEAAGEAWPALRAGFFRKSGARFVDVATRYREELLANLTWH